MVILLRPPAQSRADRLQNQGEAFRGELGLGIKPLKSEDLEASTGS
jgi:hypothetical protein